MAIRKHNAVWPEQFYVSHKVADLIMDADYSNGRTAEVYRNADRFWTHLESILWYADSTARRTGVRLRIRFHQGECRIESQ